MLQFVHIVESGERARDCLSVHAVMRELLLRKVQKDALGQQAAA